MQQAEIDSIYENAPIGLCVVGVDGQYRRINRWLAEINGYPAEYHIGRTVREVVPAIADKVDKIIEDIARTGEPHLNVEFSGETAAESGKRKHWLEQWSPLKDETGRVVAVNVVVQDITQSRQHEHQLQILTREIAHRSKNLLSVVQAIVRQTAKTATSASSFMEKVDGRVAALSSAQDLLIDHYWQGADLGQLIERQLAPFAERESHQVTLSGRPLMVCAQATQQLSLAMHELATNSTKYGALSVPNGTILIEWSLRDVHAAEDSRFFLRWVESGGPTVEPSGPEKGFGSLVLQKLVPSALNASAHIEYPPSGLRWTLESNDGWFCLE
jgi:PAS domain S-box-containing protein